MEQTIRLECDIADIGPSPLFDDSTALRALVMASDIARAGELAGVDVAGMKLGAFASHPALRCDGVIVGQVLAITRTADGLAIDFEFDADDGGNELHQRYASRCPPMLSLGMAVSGVQRDANGDSITKWELTGAFAQPKPRRERMYDEDQNEWDG